MGLDPTQTNTVLAEGNIKQGLDLQAYLKTIVESENQRLKTQEVSIDTAYTSKQRGLHLNESYRKRYAEYLKIMVIMIVALFVFLGLLLLEANFDFIPSIYINILMAIVVAITIYILSYTSFYDLFIRDMVTYDEIDSSYLQNVLMGSGVKVISGSGTLGSGSTGKEAGSCVNQECCDVGTKWCPVNYQCISNSNFAKDCPFDATVQYNNYIMGDGYATLEKYI
jgi:hypothetical protein